MLGDILDATVKKEGSAITQYTFTGQDGTLVQTVDRNVALDHMFASFAGQNADVIYKDHSHTPNVGFLGNFLAKMAYSGYDPTAGAPIPLPGAPQELLQTGYVLKQDKIPAMDRAAYIKVRRQLSDTVGVEAQFLW